MTLQAWVEFEGMSFEGYDYSAGWEAFGWFLELTPIVITFSYPVYLAVRLWRNLEPGNTVLQSMTSPNRSWYETERGDRKDGEVEAAAAERRRSIISSFDIPEKANGEKN